MSFNPGGEPEKSITETIFITAAMVQIVAISILGGLAKYYNDLGRNRIAHTWFLFFAQVFTSALAGIITYLAGDYFNLSMSAVGAIAGVAGWSGAEFMKFLEQLAKTWSARKVLTDKQIERLSGITRAEDHHDGCMCNHCKENRSDD